MRRHNITAWALSAFIAFGGCAANETGNTEDLAVPTVVINNQNDSNDTSKDIIDNTSENSNVGTDNIIGNLDVNNIGVQENASGNLTEVLEVPTEAVSSTIKCGTDVTVVKLKGSTAEVTGDEDGNVKVKDGEITIKGAGTYMLSGTYTGNIEINGKDGDVTLLLNGVDLTSETLAPLYIKKTENTYITLVDGSVNILTDAAEYQYGVDDEGNVEEDPSACLHVKGNLTIDGTGTLVINANYNDGLKSSKELTINNGKYVVTSKGDAISSSKAGVTVNDGEFVISCNGGAANGTTHHDSFDMGGRGWGFFGGNNQNTQTVTTDDISSKAIKAETFVTINGGNINIDASDDAIHANTDVTVSGGTFVIATGDDGVHADETLVINDCNMTITKSYEGLEAMNITINGGVLDITASDDGVNAAGGDSSMSMGFPGWGSSSSASLVVNGGALKVNAGGDGVDSNGNMEFNGGVIIIDGPTDNSNTAVDSDQAFIMNGGSLLAVGSTGMLEYPSTASTQPVVIWTPGNVAAGTKITITDKNNNVLFEYTATKTFQGVIFSSKELVVGESYKLSAGNNTVEFTLSYQITAVSSNGTVSEGTNRGGMGFGGQGGFGGNMGGFNKGDRNNGNFGGNNSGNGNFGGNRDDRNNMNGQMPEGNPPEGFDGQMPEGNPPDGFGGNMPNQ